VNRYKASIATAVLGVVTLSHGQTLSRSSFSSSVIASAFSKFHGVKAPSAASTPAVVAVATRVDQPTVQQGTKIPLATAPIVATVVPSQPGPSFLAPKPAEKVVEPPTPAPVEKKEDYQANNGIKVQLLTADELDKVAGPTARLAGGPLADPESLEVTIPESARPDIDVTAGQKGTRNLKLKWVEEGYFDLGYEKLIGTFSDQILRYGVRYGDDDLHVYVRNSTLDTRGTGLPYPQVVTGLSAGVEARHWFPGNKMYVCVSVGDGISGFNKDKTDTRVGMVGYTNWRHEKWFSDFYGELFYIALASDTFLDWRIRSGQILKEYKDQSYLWAYVVGQFWAAGTTVSGTENRMEFGPGIGYMFRNAVSVNFEMRAGYAFNGVVDDGGHHAYWNPTLIIAGGFYKGWP